MMSWIWVGSRISSASVFERFAPDERMRLYGRGIRRRLAPMLGDREHEELAYSMLFSLPGSPVIRFGDELGWATTSTSSSASCAYTDAMGQRTARRIHNGGEANHPGDRPGCMELRARERGGAAARPELVP